METQTILDDGPREATLFAVYIMDWQGCLRFRGHCLDRGDALAACGSDYPTFADVREERGIVWRGRAFCEHDGSALAPPAEIKHRDGGRIVL